MTRHGLALLVLLLSGSIAACGGGNDDVDCDRVIDRYTAAAGLTTTAEGRATLVAECRAQDLTREQAECIVDADDMIQLGRCPLPWRGRNPFARSAGR